MNIKIHTYTDTNIYFHKYISIHTHTFRYIPYMDIQIHCRAKHILSARLNDKNFITYLDLL